MKKECDKNGLEYEILVQDSAKERFLRQVSSYHPFSDLTKNFVIMKQKREPSPTPEPAKSSADPIVGAANPQSSPSKPTSSRSSDAEGADHMVGAANPKPDAGEDEKQMLGMPIAGKMAAGILKFDLKFKVAILILNYSQVPQKQLLQELALNLPSEDSRQKLQLLLKPLRPQQLPKKLL